MKIKYRLLCTLKELNIVKKGGGTDRLRRQAKNNDIALIRSITVVRNGIVKRNAA